MQFKYSKLTVAMSLALGMMHSAAASASGYSMLDLGNVFATALNNNGQVVGYSGTMGSSGSEAFITGANGVGLTNLGGYGSYATGINASGQVVGDSGNHAFITGVNGVGLTNIGGIGGYSTGATGINASGQVVGYNQGYSITGSPSANAYITGANGVGMTDLSLGGLGGYTIPTYVMPTGINASGQVVGYYGTIGSTSSDGFITGVNGVGMTNLGGGRAGSGATGINASGQVVGYDITGSDSFIAYITGPNGVGMTDLGNLGGGYSIATGINASGQVVGSSNMGSGQVAFITGANGVSMTNLNSLVQLTGGDYFTNATGINDKGQLIAQTVDGSAYLLTPTSAVPEPGKAVLLSVGLLALALARKHTPR